jgi:hypothetical protein
MPNFDVGFFVIVTILVTSSWPVLAQPQGLQQAAAPFGNPSQQLQQEDAAQKPIMSNGPDMSSRYNKQRFSDEGVGKVMNNGTESAEFVEVLATFRDASGAVIDTATGYADPHLVTAGDSAPFNILLTSDIIEDKATSYDLTLKWRDLDFEEFSKDVLRGHSTERLVTKKMTAEVMEMMMMMMMAMYVNPTWDASSRKIENGPRIILETLMS